MPALLRAAKIFTTKDTKDTKSLTLNNRYLTFESLVVKLFRGKIIQRGVCVPSCK